MSWRTRTCQASKKAPPSTFSREPTLPNGFAIDNGTNRGTFAKEPLVASNLNLRRGGKQPKMRGNSEIVLSLRSMDVFPWMTVQNCAKHARNPHGGADCKDRCNLSSDCCTRSILAAERDFVEQKSCLQEVERRGHIAHFYPSELQPA